MKGAASDVDTPSWGNGHGVGGSLLGAAIAMAAAGGMLLETLTWERLCASLVTRRIITGI